LFPYGYRFKAVNWRSTEPVKTDPNLKFTNTKRTNLIKVMMLGLIDRINTAALF
jgi:hypothetical protein